MLHVNAKEHDGILITYGRTIVACKSFKMKLVTKSSTKSELESVTMKDPELKVTRPVKMMQANLSAIGVVIDNEENSIDLNI